MNTDYWIDTVEQNIPTYPTDSIFATLAKAAVGIELLMDHPAYSTDTMQLQRIADLVRRLADDPTLFPEDRSTVNSLYGIYVIQGFEVIPDFDWNNQALFLRIALCVGELYQATKDQIDSFNNLIKVEMSNMITRKFTGPAGVPGK